MNPTRCRIWPSFAAHDMVSSDRSLPHVRLEAKPDARRSAEWPFRQLDRTCARSLPSSLQTRSRSHMAPRSCSGGRPCGLCHERVGNHRRATGTCRCLSVGYLTDPLSTLPGTHRSVVGEDGDSELAQIVCEIQATNKAIMTLASGVFRAFFPTAHEKVRSCQDADHGITVRLVHRDRDLCGGCHHRERLMQDGHLPDGHALRNRLIFVASNVRTLLEIPSHNLLKRRTCGALDAARCGSVRRCSSLHDAVD